MQLLSSLDLETSHIADFKIGTSPKAILSIYTITSKLKKWTSATRQPPIVVVRRLSDWDPTSVRPTLE